ncbi:MAG: hypothetical protein ACLRYM_06135 [Thomasclavelia ramosa]
MYKKIVILIFLTFFIGGCENNLMENNDEVITPLKKVTVEKISNQEISEEIKTTDENESNFSKINNNSIKETKEKVKKKILENSISIPDVCTGASLTIGSTQQTVDIYDICIMTEANNSNFGDGKPILIGGHNTKSLKYLYRAEVNTLIDVNYNSNLYQYKIIYSNECTNDGYKLYDIDTGINILDYSLKQEVLYIYTCYNSNNWLIKAVRI